MIKFWVHHFLIRYYLRRNQKMSAIACHSIFPPENASNFHGSQFSCTEFCFAKAEAMFVLSYMAQIWE